MGEQAKHTPWTYEWMEEASDWVGRDVAQLIAAAPEMAEALEPDLLDAIADEIDGFEHSARAASLRGLAARQRAALSKALGQEGS